MKITQLTLTFILALAFLTPMIAAVDVGPNVTFSQGSYWYNTTSNFTVTNITINAVDLYFDDIPVCVWYGFPLYLISNRTECGTGNLQTAFGLIAITIIGLFLYYGVRLKEEGLLPLRLLLLATGIGLLPLFGYVSVLMAQTDIASSDINRLLVSGWQTSLWFFIILIFTIFLLLLLYSVKVWRGKKSASIFDQED